MAFHALADGDLVEYFSKVPPDTALKCLTDLLRHNRQDLQIAMQVAIKYHEQIGAGTIVKGARSSALQ